VAGVNLVPAKPGADCSVRCAGMRIGHLLFVTHPPPPSHSRKALCHHCVCVYSPQRVFIHCSDMLCPTIGIGAGKHTLAAPLAWVYPGWCIRVSEKTSTRQL
jgi:hypothetical protein